MRVTFCCYNKVISGAHHLQIQTFPEIYSIFFICSSYCCWWQQSFVPSKCVSCCFMMQGFIFSKAWWFHIKKISSDQCECQQCYVIFLTTTAVNGYFTGHLAKATQFYGLSKALFPFLRERKCGDLFWMCLSNNLWPPRFYLWAAIDIMTFHGWSYYF